MRIITCVSIEFVCLAVVHARDLDAAGAAEDLAGARCTGGSFQRIPERICMYTNDTYT